MIAAYQVGLMAILISLGFLCAKIKVISKEGTKTLSSIVANIANPATVFIAFQIGYSSEKLSGLAFSLILTIVTFIISYIVAFVLIRGKNIERKTAEQVAAIYSNCGFMGIPLVRGVFGNEGVFYLAVYIAVFNLLIWTAGAIQVQGKADKKAILNSLLNPSIIAVVCGISAFLAGIKLPPVLADTVGYLADLTTPVAMLVAGSLIAGADLLSLIKKHRVYFTTLIRLIIIPCAVYFSFLFVPVDGLLKSVILTAAACPTGTITVILAVKYNKQSVYAAELFAITTIFSMLTLPFIINLPF